MAMLRTILNAPYRRDIHPSHSPGAHDDTDARIWAESARHRLRGRRQLVQSAATAKLIRSLAVVRGSSRIGVCPTPDSNSTRAPDTTR